MKFYRYKLPSISRISELKQESSVVETNCQRVIIGRPDGPAKGRVSSRDRNADSTLWISVFRIYIHMAAAAPSHAQPLRACRAYIGLAGRDVAGLASFPNFVCCLFQRQSENQLPIALTNIPQALLCSLSAVLVRGCAAAGLGARNSLCCRSLLLFLLLLPPPTLPSPD